MLSVSCEAVVDPGEGGAGERLDPVLTYEFHEGLSSFNLASLTFSKCSCIVKNLRYIFVQRKCEFMKFSEV